VWLNQNHDAARNNKTLAQSLCDDDETEMQENCQSNEKVK